MTDTTTSTVDLVERLRANRVTTLEQVYAANGEPNEFILEKHTSYLTPLLREFIAKAPFWFISTSDAHGNCDVSPKGDPPGGIQFLDDFTIAIPDRAGNRRVDGHSNLVQNGHIGLLFIIPNVDEAVRVNGRAFLTTDPELLETMAMQGKVPKLATIVEIDQVYVHCARPMLRGGIWKTDLWPDPDTIPTLGSILAEQKDWPAPDESQGKRQEEYRSELY
jgi:PPOX class probable FMN-dependent enzyme